MKTAMEHTTAKFAVGEISVTQNLTEYNGTEVEILSGPVFGRAYGEGRPDEIGAFYRVLLPDRKIAFLLEQELRKRPEPPIDLAARRLELRPKLRR